MKRLRAVLAKGLDATASSWPEIREAFGWIRRFAAVLTNKPDLDAAGVRRRYDGLVAALARHGDFGVVLGCWGRWPRAGSRPGRWPVRWATS